MPSPPQHRSSNDIIWRIKEHSHNSRNDRESKSADQNGGETCSAVENEVSRSDDGEIHETDVDAGDVKWETRSEHNDGLSLPEVVDDWKRHEEDIVGGSGDQSGDEDVQVGETVSISVTVESVDETSDGAEDEEKFSTEEGRHVLPLLIRIFDEFPREFFIHFPRLHTT